MNPEFQRFQETVRALCAKLNPVPITPAAAKVELKKRGYTYRSAAPVIGRSYHWICQVVNNRATSRPVLEEIFRLPIREKKGAKA